MAYEVLNQGFYVSANLLFDNGESEDITSSIIDVMVRKRFLQDAFPLYVIDLQTTENIRNSIRDRECSIALRISYYNIVSSENTDGGGENTPEEEVIVDDIIRLYEKPFVTTASKKDDDSDNDSDENPQKEAPFIYYRVSGVPESLIVKNRNIINRIYSNTKIINPIVNILSEFGKKMYIQQVDNNEKYRSILIPPLTSIAAIRYLDETYDIYNDGYILFLDSSKVYLLSPFTSNIQYTNAFNITIKSVESTAGNIENGKILFDKENNDYKFSFNNVPTFTDNKKIISDSVGSYTVFYSYDDNFNLNKRSVSNDESFDKIRYFWNSNGKKATEDSIFNTRTIGFNVNLVNINPEIFTPLTRVSVESEYNNVAGEYTIGSVSYMFKTEGENRFRCYLDLSLVKK